MAIKNIVETQINVTGQETVADAAQAYKDLGEAVSETQRKAEKLTLEQGKNHPETQEAIRLAGKYKQEMEELDFAIDAARGGSDQLFRAAQGVTAGFEVAAGATALFGGQSEVLEKTLLRVQGALALSQGLKDFKEFGPAVKALTKDTLAWVKSLRLARVALAGLGIGALVALFYTFRDSLGGVIDKIYEFTDALGITTKAQDRAIAAQQRSIDSMNRELELMTAKGATEQEIYEQTLKIAQAEEKIAKEKLALLEEGNEGYEDAVKAVEDATNQIAVIEATETKRLKDKAKEDAKARREAMFGNAEEMDAELANLQDQFKQMEKFQQDHLNEMGNIAQVARKQQATEQLNAQQEEQQILENLRQEQLITEEEYLKRSQDLTDYYNKKKAQSDREYRQAKRDLDEKNAIEGSQMLLDLNNIFQNQREEQNEEEFEREKAFAIAQTLISTYFAAQRAYNSQLTLTPDSPIRAAIAAAAAITSGLSRVASIRRTRFETESADTTSNPSTGGFGQSLNAPAVRLPRTEAFTGERRVYVTEYDISNTQERVKVTEDVSIVK